MYVFFASVYLLNVYTSYRYTLSKCIYLLKIYIRCDSLVYYFRITSYFFFATICSIAIIIAIKVLSLYLLLFSTLFERFERCLTFLSID